MQLINIDSIKSKTMSKMTSKWNFTCCIFLFLMGFTEGIRMQISSTLATSCATDLPAVGSITSLPFTATNLSCNSVWASQDFNLMYQNTGPSQWSFILSAPDNGAYISVGFSPNGRMIGASAITGWVPSGGGGVVKQYYLGGYSSSSCTPDMGNLKLVAGSTSIVSQSSRIYLAFQLDVGQPQSSLIFAVGPGGQLPSSDNLLPQHASKSSTTVGFTSSGGSQNSPVNPPSTPGDTPPATGGSPPPATSSSSSSCSSKFNVDNKLIPFDATSANCYTPWSSQDFALLFKKASPSIWSFLLSAPDTNSYISVGFSPNGKMVGSSAVVGWKPSSGSGIVKQYYLSGMSSDKCPPDQGSLQIIPGSTVLVSQSSRLFLGFQLNETEPMRNLIYAVGPQGSLPGTDGYLSTHADMTSTYIDYVTGKSSTRGSTHSLKIAHGMLALIGWGMAIPIGVAVARYGKQWDPLWFHSHTSIQTIGFFLGILALIIGFVLKGKVGEDVGKHQSLSIIIVVLGFLQVMAYIIRPGKEDKIRRYWNWYHHYVGRIALVLAVANIFYGMSLSNVDKSWNIGYALFLVVWILCCICLEIRMRLRH